MPFPLSIVVVSLTPPCLAGQEESDDAPESSLRREPGPPIISGCSVAEAFARGTLPLPALSASLHRRDEEVKGFKVGLDDFRGLFQPE